MNEFELTPEQKKQVKPFVKSMLAGIDTEYKEWALDEAIKHIDKLNKDIEILKRFPFGCDNVEHYVDEIRRLEQDIEVLTKIAEPLFTAQLSSAIMCKGCGKPCHGNEPYITSDAGINHLWHIKCAQKVLAEWEVKSMPDTELSKENARLVVWCRENAEKIRKLEQK